MAKQNSAPATKEPKSEPEQMSLPILSKSTAVDTLPDYMKGDEGLGKENIGRDDVTIFRLKLMQGLSPELQEFDGLKPGYFFHPATEYIFDKPFRAVIILMDKRYILWRPRDSGGGILARADDGIHWSPASGQFTVQLDKKDGGNNVTWKLARTVKESGLDEWGTLNPEDPNSPPAATQMYNYLLVFPDVPDLVPAVLSCQRSSITAGRDLNKKILAFPGAIFRRVWEFKSVEATNKRGQKFFNINARAAGFVEGDLYMQYRSLYQLYSQRGLTEKELEGLQTEDEGSTSAGSDATANHPPF